MTADNFLRRRAMGRAAVVFFRRPGRALASSGGAYVYRGIGQGRGCGPVSTANASLCNNPVKALSVLRKPPV